MMFVTVTTARDRSTQVSPAKSAYTQTVPIRIANPGRGAGFTSSSQAERYVRQNQAMYLDDGTLFLLSSARLDSDVRRETGGDGGLARLEEMRHYPVIAPHVLFRCHRSSRGARPNPDRVAAITTAADQARRGELAGVIECRRKARVLPRG